QHQRGADGSVRPAVHRDWPRRLPGSRRGPVHRADGAGADARRQRLRLWPDAVAAPVHATLPHGRPELLGRPGPTTGAGAPVAVSLAQAVPESPKAGGGPSAGLPCIVGLLTAPLPISA